MMRIAFTALIVSLCLSNGRISAEVFIVEEGMANAEIVVAENPPRLVTIAVQELRTYLKKISGAEVPIVTSPGTGYPVKIYVGRSEYTDQLGVTDEGLKYGAFRMVSGSDYLILLGHDFDYVPKGPIPLDPWPNSIPLAQEEWDQMTGSYWINPMKLTNKFHYKKANRFWAFDEGGSLYAVYEFLKMLGARWYMPGELGEILPEHTSIPLPSVDRTVHPDFPIRYIHWSYYGAASWDNVIWERRVGFNSGYEFLGTGTLYHGMNNVQKREEMKKAHPDHYAVFKGVRDTAASGDGHECFSSESLVQETVSYACSVFNHFSVPTTSIWPLDGYKACQCDLCKGKSASELVWNFIDRVAREVYKTHPDRLVTSGAYTSYKPPPASIDSFSPNLVVSITNCMRPSLDHPQKWAEYWDIVESWQQKIRPGNLMRSENNRFSIWNGYVDPVPFPVLHPRAIAKDLQALKGISQGEWGEVSRANPGQIWKAPGLDHLNLYVQASYLWDADQDIDTLLEEYYTLFYGPVRKEMKTALEFAQASYSRTDESRNGGRCDPMNVGLSVKIQLLELLHAARDSAGETVYGRRIQKIIDELPPLDSIRPEIREKATLTVVDRSSGDPVYRAEIRYGETVHATDYSGRAILDDIEEGKWVFTVDHNAYFPLTDSLVFSSDTGLVIPLTKRLATIRFEVRDSTGPLEDVPVSLFGWEILTDSEGRVVYNNQPARRQYTYTVSQNGYEHITDSLYLEIDTTVSVMLQPVTGTDAFAITEIAVFPNPASESIYIRTGPLNNVTIRLFNPEGKKLVERSPVSGSSRINVSEFSPGFYFLQIETDYYIAYRKVLIQKL